MWPSKCSLSVEASFSSDDSSDHCERCESRRYSTYGTYIYDSCHGSRRGRSDRSDRLERSERDGKFHRRRETQIRDRELRHGRHRCHDGDEPCRGRSPARCSGDECRVVLEVVDRTAPGSDQRHYSRRHEQSYSVSVSVRTATEDILAHLMTDSHAQEVLVHWRDGDKEPLHRSMSVRTLANDAVYLEVRNRRSSCRCC